MIKTMKEYGDEEALWFFKNPKIGARRLIEECFFISI